MVEDRVGEFETVLCRVEEIGGDHGVAAESPERNAAFGKDDEGGLQIMAVLANARIGQEGAEGLENRPDGKLRISVFMGDRDVKPLARQGRNGQTDERGPHRLRRGEDRFEGEFPDLAQPGNERRQFLRRPDDAVVSDGLFPADL